MLIIVLIRTERCYLWALLQTAVLIGRTRYYLWAALLAKNSAYSHSTVHNQWVLLANGRAYLHSAVLPVGATCKEPCLFTRHLLTVGSTIQQPCLFTRHLFTVGSTSQQPCLFTLTVLVSLSPLCRFEHLARFSSIFHVRYLVCCAVYLLIYLSV